MYNLQLRTKGDKNEIRKQNIDHGDILGYSSRNLRIKYIDGH